ncbi:MAG: Dihydroneopterin aldolase [Candidatus Lokiarchaeum sp. GC14_75]|nr:MAG: Dihydroneopterin aldolase [Candidatus Lokiarchaeum sp. GC14_75]
MTGQENIYFSPDVTVRERACFETGIKLGALYHILCGIPISSDERTVKSIEKGIEAAISCQPFVKSITIQLNKDKIVGNQSTPFDYDEITGKIIRAEVLIEFESVEIAAKLDWVDDLQYPLMFIESIKEVK